MSLRQKEHGEYTLPAGEFNRLVREFESLWDKRMAHLFSVADWVYQNCKGKTLLSVTDDAYNGKLEFSGETVDAAMEVFAPQDYRKKVRKPLKKDFRARGFKNICKGADRKRKAFVNLEITSTAQLAFDFESRRVIWDVEESNRSVDRARESEFGRWFFGFLKGVKWRGRTGGETLYIDENMEDAGQLEPHHRDLHGWEKKQMEKSLGVKLR